MPERLASGAPLLAYGPRGVATIDYLEAAGIAEVVTEKGGSGLADAIERLVAEPARGAALTEAARAHVEAHLSRSMVQRRFRDAMCEAWAIRSEEQTSELQSLMRNSIAVFCLKNK